MCIEVDGDVQMHILGSEQAIENIEASPSPVRCGAVESRANRWWCSRMERADRAQSLSMLYAKIEAIATPEELAPIKSIIHRIYSRVKRRVSARNTAILNPG